MKLILEGLTKYLVSLIITSTLIFMSSGTIKNYNAWILLIILFIPILFFGIYLYMKNPELLKERLNSKEKENEQKLVQILSLIIFIVGFIICGLDFKYKWTNIKTNIQIISCISLLTGYLLFIKTTKYNKYLYRTIKINKNQKLIDTGLYRIIRHPMYLSSLLIFISIPLILKSLYGFYIFLLFIIILIIRIKKEEKILVKQLKGYSSYKLKVKYKLIPYIW